MRALLTDLGVVDDPDARTMLSPTFAAIVAGARRLPARTWRRSVSLAGLGARSSWFDERVVCALEDGTTQVAVVGAGYDSRAWRLHRDGVRSFELDHAPTQADKVRRAPAGPGPTYVVADLATQPAADALRSVGLDGSVATLFLLEGVVMYLDEAAVRRQLEGLAAVAGPGSRLLVDLYPPRAETSTTHRRQHGLQRLARAGSEERLRFAVEPEEGVALVRASGWRIEEVTSLRAAAQALVPRSSGLPVDAIDERKTLVAASRPLNPLLPAFGVTGDL